MVMINLYYITVEKKIVVMVYEVINQRLEIVKMKIIVFWNLVIMKCAHVAQNIYALKNAL